MQALRAEHRISIHALREEGDPLRFPASYLQSISIHALREEGDPPQCCLLLLFSYFYPRPPRGGRPKLMQELTKTYKISIHALREEGDLVWCLSSISSSLFLSTPSARRATNTNGCLVSKIGISIHALREEGDLHQEPVLDVEIKFLSTPSARRATPDTRRMVRTLDDFYPRPPRGGRQSAPRPQYRGSCYFYPRPPRGGRPVVLGPRCLPFYFYPRPPRGGRRNTAYQRGMADIFLSTPSARRATAKTETKSLFSNKLYNILHEFRRALIYNGSKNYPNHAK